MSQPTQTCTICGRKEIVRPDGRGFPPAIAKKRLIQRCKDNDCACNPEYLAGVLIPTPNKPISTANLFPKL